ncbi:glycosyltransferase family protein [Falsiroseomonas oryziterrae]|uniref:glycosyltransferase family protein n=1 Tax=Falsiroseomonas oryziterrae TaxID=2911368 RepID=UPI001F384712|nr:glycosyltransferase [Roseomonas sp. NPKOSM-4]
MQPGPAHPDPALLARIPLGLGTMAEIGAEPVLATWLARHDPLCRPVAPASAPPGSVDLVVLRGLDGDASRAVRQAATLLAEDGILLTDLPNAEDWRLAEGGAPAPPDAVTLPFLLGALRAAGLVPIDMPAEAPDDAARDFAARSGPGDPGLLRRIAPARWRLRAARRAARPLFVLAHLLRSVAGVNDVRVGHPLRMAATHPGMSARLSETPVLHRFGSDVPRILLLQRRLLSEPTAPTLVNTVRAAGYVVVQEFDDEPSLWPSIAESDHFAFRGVHAVQTSTAPLAELFGRFNEEVAIFPNTSVDLPPPANFTDPRRLTIFLGALRRERDTAPFLPALNAVLAEAGDRLAVEVLYDRSAFEALATPHKRFHGVLPYDAYRALMARCEIALLPLDDTFFNRCKSDLKFVEAGSLRLCCLASPVVYGGTVRDGETGIIMRDPAEMAAALRAMLAAPERARAIGDAARGWVTANRMMASQVRTRLAWYRSLWERRAELDAALLSRAPELR